MQFASVNEERCLPTPKLVGRCVGCGQEMIAKCGELKVWHWAHKGMRNCDPWWEPETTWHREWKELFPEDWREVLQRASSGEKHIADVRNSGGLVIEFQHSAISAAERTAREAFYQNLVWVVDGTRLKYDVPRFDKGSSGFSTSIRPGYFMTRWPDECFPKQWIACSKPVFFDFGGHEYDPDFLPPRAAFGNLWCLLPHRVGDYAVVAKISKAQFVETAHRLADSFPPISILQEIADYMNAQRQVRREAENERLRRARIFRANRLRSRSRGW